jgi:glycine/D-amino acid oxidase-like deaminating enzyme
MLATEPIPERLFECPHSRRHGFDYWQQREDGRILVGGFRDTALDDEFTTSEETTPAIQSSLERLVSDLVGWPVVPTHRWAGLFGFVPDFMPVVGRVPGEKGLWVSGGYSGRGMVLGFMCGELVANAILGRETPDLDLFDPARLL